MSLCFYSPLENELWFYCLEYSAGKAQLSSILKSDKFVTSMKHRGNTSKEKSVFRWKTYLMIFFSNTAHTQLPCPTLLHRGKGFEMKMSDIVKIPDQYFRDFSVLRIKRLYWLRRQSCHSLSLPYQTILQAFLRPYWL